MTGTPATVALGRAGIAFTEHQFDARAVDGGYGRAAADALGLDPATVFKTLLVVVDAGAAVAIVPVAAQVDLKALAAAVGAKRAEMMDPKVAERRTGYVVGGISPFGQKQRSPTVVDESALDHEKVYVSGGRRGLDLGLAPRDLVGVLDARVSPIAR